MRGCGWDGEEHDGQYLRVVFSQWLLKWLLGNVNGCHEMCCECQKVELEERVDQLKHFIATLGLLVLSFALC